MLWAEARSGCELRAMSALTDVYERIAVCPDCDLCQSRNRAVPGEGPEDAEIMFVGEAPGFYEDQLGRPFVGPAGRFLEELLASIGVRRDQVYIGNLIKCRPPENRDPLPKEIEACRQWLSRQIELIKPKVIATLGRYSLAWFFPDESIGRVHGQTRYRDGIYFLPMYHPAAALHAASMRCTIEEDFRKLPAALEEARKGPREEVAEPEQMRLF
jgi:uracil-DNA glycosylase